jgi:hypothetical protein
MARIGHWLAGDPNWPPSRPRPDLDERIEAVIERVDGIETRVTELERDKDATAGRDGK